jgi:lysozyme family protein
MAEFAQALAKIFEAEGRDYTDRASDRGGPTKFGITLKTLAEFRGCKVTAGDVEKLTELDAATIYRALYWEKMQLDGVVSQPVAMALFDQGVNRGAYTVTRQVQKALRDLGETVTTDGVFGPMTLNALNHVPARKFLVEFIARCYTSYAQIVEASPDQAVNIEGWVSRTNKLLHLLVDVA